MPLQSRSCPTCRAHLDPHRAGRSARTACSRTVTVPADQTRCAIYDCTVHVDEAGFTRSRSSGSGSGSDQSNARIRIQSSQIIMTNRTRPWVLGARLRSWSHYYVTGAILEKVFRFSAPPWLHILTLTE